MDRKIESSGYKKYIKKAIGITGLVVLFGGIYSVALSSGGGREQNISEKSLTIKKVKRGLFEDTLNVRGIIKPKTTLYLDSMAGGRVEEKLIEQGEFVEKGQPLVRLSNDALQLDVISREAQISEQLNFLRNTQMLAENNSLSLRREILDNKNQINHLKRNISRLKILTERKVAAKNDLLELEQNLEYFENVLALNLERQSQEKKLRAIQIKQLEESAKQLQTNLKFSRNNLDKLLMRAPVSGYLSELNVELGEFKPAGTRLGQIDIPDQYKILASVDEFYLNLMSVGMSVQVELNGHLVESEVAKIDSRVKESQFFVEVDLPSDIEGIKRGQSIELEISIGADNHNGLLLQKGAFVNSTGGNWVFVVDAASGNAVRRDIKLGKKNQHYYQVINGLEEGERVVTSSYASFNQADILLLN